MFFYEQAGQNYEVFKRVRRDKKQLVATFYGGDGVKEVKALARAERFTEDENRIALLGESDDETPINYT